MSEQIEKGCFDEFKERVLAEQARSADDTKDLRRDMVALNLEGVKSVGNVRIEIAELKIKAGVWGLLGGLIPVLLALGMWMLTRK